MRSLWEKIFKTNVLYNRKTKESAIFSKWLESELNKSINTKTELRNRYGTWHQKKENPSPTQTPAALCSTDPSQKPAWTTVAQVFRAARAPHRHQELGQAGPSQKPMQIAARAGIQKAIIQNPGIGTMISRTEKASVRLFENWSPLGQHSHLNKGTAGCIGWNKKTPKKVSKPDF